MTRYDGQRLADIQAAISAISEHMRRGTLSDGLVFDAVRVRLIEIGEAVKGLSEELLATEESIPWAERCQECGIDSLTDTSTPLMPWCKPLSIMTCRNSKRQSPGWQPAPVDTDLGSPSRAEGFAISRHGLRSDHERPGCRPGTKPRHSKRGFHPISSARPWW
jgi:hypothetical protein